MFVQLQRIKKSFLMKHNYSTYIPVSNKISVTKPDWKTSISEAKKCVGFSNSLWNISCLKTDKMAGYITKLLQKSSSDSTFKIANSFLSINKSGMLAGGLIVLLYSKTMTRTKDDLLQRTLAEITEMIKMSRQFHKAIININMKTKGKDENDIQNWNKVSLLSGDFFLAKSFDEVAKLRNQKLNEIMALTCRDFAESEFIGDRDIENKPLPNQSDIILENPEIEWTIRNTLSDGSLLATCCKGSMILSKQSEKSQKQAYLFGKHFALAVQASLELNIFKTPYKEASSFSLVSAPVLFHLQNDKSLFEEINKGRVSVKNINFQKIHRDVLNGSGLEKTQNLVRTHTKIVEDMLDRLPASNYRNHLNNIISSIN